MHPAKITSAAAMTVMAIKPAMFLFFMVQLLLALLVFLKQDFSVYTIQCFLVEYSVNMVKKHIAQAKVTVRKQIAIPKKVQEELGGLEEGKYIMFFKEGDKICIEKGAITPESKKQLLLLQV